LQAYLRPELARGERSLFYHMFSAEALTLMAWVAGVNGIDLYTAGNFALSRLTQNIIMWVVTHHVAFRVL
jgi:hypothetical protein